MSDRVTLNELDILAYADGLLDCDPARKAEVERRLRDDPEAMERARSFAAQTVALREAYDSRVAEAVPQRLHAVLERPTRSTGAQALQAAAIVALLVGTGVGGWLLGRSDDPDRWSVATLIDQSYAHFFASRPGEPPAEAVQAAVSEARPLGWLADEVSIRLKAPDLSAAGYALVDKQTVMIGEDQIVRLDYASSDKGAFSLFLAPRWETQPVEIAHTERDGISLAYWLDGPLASTIVTRLPSDQARDLARTVREAMHAGKKAPAVIEPEGATPARPPEGMIADTGTSPTNNAAPQLILEPGEPMVTPN